MNLLPTARQSTKIVLSDRFVDDEILFTSPKGSELHIIDVYIPR